MFEQTERNISVLKSMKHNISNLRRSLKENRSTLSQLEEFKDFIYAKYRALSSSLTRPNLITKSTDTNAFYYL